MALTDDVGVTWYSVEEFNRMAHQSIRRTLLAEALASLELGLQQLRSALELEEDPDAQTLDDKPDRTRGPARACSSTGDPGQPTGKAGSSTNPPTAYSQGGKKEEGLDD